MLALGATVEQESQQILADTLGQLPEMLGGPLFLGKSQLHLG
jgi:hypothetical protein